MERPGERRGSAVAVGSRLIAVDGAVEETSDAPFEVPAGARSEGDGRGPSSVDPFPAPWVRSAGWSLLGVQLLAMLAFSTFQYSRFALSEDFANYSQAWWSIGHGNLDPFISGLGVPFWRDNAEFILYPLALLSHVDPHPLTLLWLQDAAVVATELVTFRWILSAVERSRGRVPRRWAAAVGLGAAVVLVANPWAYETIAFDFHFEPFAALFCVLVGYDLWAGRTRRLWLWVPLALACHVLAGTYLVGIGLSGMLAGRRTRVPGAVIAAVGLGWTLAFSALGAAGVKGKNVAGAYGYLVGSHHGRIGLPTIAVGALGHLGAAVSVAASHAPVALLFLIPVGVVGVVSPWGFGMALAVLVPNVLDADGIFIRFGAAFQSWPALVFVLVGSVMVLLRLIERGAGTGRPARRVAAVREARRFAAVWAASLGAVSVVVLATFPHYWLTVDAPAAKALAHVDAVIPAGAEVIASVGVMGRFAQRDSVYGFTTGHQQFPVDRRLVVFVFTTQGGPDDVLRRHEGREAVDFVRNRLHGRVLGAGSGVSAFAWSAPPGTTRVSLP